MSTDPAEQWLRCQLCGSEDPGKRNIGRWGKSTTYCPGSFHDRRRMTTDPAEQWQAHVTDSLQKRRCPHSGLDLATRHYWWREGLAGEPVLACSICDCVGYDPDDERIGKR